MSPTPLRRERVLVAICALMCAALGVLLLARIGLRWGATASSYAALSDAFLHGRLWIEKCPEIDCALWQGRTYVIFPPLPATLLAPFVVFTGAGFKGQMLVALALVVATLWLWRRIFRALEVERASS